MLLPVVVMRVAAGIFSSILSVLVVPVEAALLAGRTFCSSSLPLLIVWFFFCVSEFRFRVYKYQYM